MENSPSRAHPAALVQWGRLLWLLSLEEQEVVPGKPDSLVHGLIRRLLGCRKKEER